MTTIWKYTLGKEDEFKLDVPMGSELLSVQIQAGEPVAWFYCRDDEKHQQRYHFRWVMTGSKAPGDRDWRYVTTLQLSEGRVVYHLFVRQCAHVLYE